MERGQKFAPSGQKPNRPKKALKTIIPSILSTDNGDDENEDDRDNTWWLAPYDRIAANGDKKKVFTSTAVWCRASPSSSRSASNMPFSRIKTNPKIVGNEAATTSYLPPFPHTPLQSTNREERRSTIYHPSRPPPPPPARLFNPQIARK